MQLINAIIINRNINKNSFNVFTYFVAKFKINLKSDFILYIQLLEMFGFA